MRTEGLRIKHTREEPNIELLRAPTGVLTFSQAVAQTNLPRLQSFPAVEAQYGGLVQAEDGQGERDPLVPLCCFQPANLLQGDTGSLLVALGFVTLVFENQHQQAV